MVLFLCKVVDHGSCRFEIPACENSEGMEPTQAHDKITDGWTMCGWSQGRANSNVFVNQV